MDLRSKGINSQQNRNGTQKYSNKKTHSDLSSRRMAQLGLAYAGFLCNPQCNPQTRKSVARVLQKQAQQQCKEPLLISLKRFLETQVQYSRLVQSDSAGKLSIDLDILYTKADKPTKLSADFQIDHRVFDLAAESLLSIQESLVESFAKLNLPNEFPALIPVRNLGHPMCPTFSKNVFISFPLALGQSPKDLKEMFALELLDNTDAIWNRNVKPRLDCGLTKVIGTRRPFASHDPSVLTYLYGLLHELGHLFGTASVLGMDSESKKDIASSAARELYADIVAVYLSRDLPEICAFLLLMRNDYYLQTFKEHNDPDNLSSTAFLDLCRRDGILGIRNNTTEIDVRNLSEVSSGWISELLKLQQSRTELSSVLRPTYKGPLAPALEGTCA